MPSPSNPISCTYASIASGPNLYLLTQRCKQRGSRLIQRFFTGREVADSLNLLIDIGQVEVQEGADLRLVWMMPASE